MPNEASDLLKRNANRIMKIWEERANNEIVAALNLDSLVLRNNLPDLLSQIADALSTTIDRTAARIKWDRKKSLNTGKSHGHTRAGSLDYTMDQMIFEFHILREVICDVLEEERMLTAVEREVIVCAIEQSVNDAATQFTETMRSIQERLASSLTHDLRGSIIGTKISAQLLLRRPGDVEYGIKVANQICESMDRLDLMIHELLDASMVRAGERSQLKMEEFDLGVLTAQSVEELNRIYGNRIIFAAHSPQKGFWNKNGIRRVIENLVTNAVKYGAPDTPITITIGQNDSNVALSVHNAGKPIPLEEQPQLFEQFHRSESAQTKAGWGLGLTAVKGVMEAHGGTVRLESTESKGTTFTIELPRDARAVRPKATP